jgi:hypothetical protein
MGDKSSMDIDPRLSLAQQAAQFTQDLIAESGSSPSPKTVVPPSGPRLRVPTAVGEGMQGLSTETLYHRLARPSTAIPTAETQPLFQTPLRQTEATSRSVGQAPKSPMRQSIFEEEIAQRKLRELVGKPGDCKQFFYDLVQSFAAGSSSDAVDGVVASLLKRRVSPRRPYI